MKLFFFILFLTQIYSHPEFLKLIPNSDRVPCNKEAECGNNNICKAPGHKNCDGGDLDAFGAKPDKPGWNIIEEFKLKGINLTNGKYIWSEWLCLMDSDGDGKTNGDELGDPCCIYNAGDKPFRTMFISNPGDKTSVTKEPSCYLNGVPSMPEIYNLKEDENGEMKLEVKDKENECICKYKVSINKLINENNNKEKMIEYYLSPNAKIFDLSFLNKSMKYEIEITSINMKGESSKLTKEIEKKYSYINNINNNNNNNYLASYNPVRAGSLTSLKSGKKQSKMVNAFYNLLKILIVLEIVKSLLRKYKYNYYLFLKSDVLINDTRISIYHLILFCCVLISSLSLLYGSYLKHGVYGIGICFGKIAMILLGFILFPITKLNIFGYLFGWSFDKTIRIHRLCGWLCIWSIILHFVIVIAHKQSIVFMFSWEGKVPVFPGTIAYFIFMFVGLSSRYSVRRKHYMFFYFSHLSTLVALIFSYLHVTKFINILLPSLVIYIIDKLVYLYQYFQKTEVISLNVIDDTQSSVLKMVLKKKDFKYKSGQYVLLNIPSVSIMSHPFSIASNPIKYKDGTFVLYIKDLGKWTHHLNQLISSNHSSEDDGDGDDNNNNSIISSNTSLINHYNKVNIIRIKDLGSKYVTIFGPYGYPSIDIHKYKVLVFIGAGVGCVPMYSLFSNLASHSTEEDEFKNVSLIWTFRGDCLYKEWKNDLKYIVTNKSHFHVYLHCTNGYESLKNEKDFSIDFNRPNLEDYLNEIRSECINLKENKVGIYICGNDDIVKEVVKYTRKENAKTLGRFRYDVDNETFHF